MQEKELIVTESELAAWLTKEMLEEVSPRLVGDWRRKELLPPFEATGSGLGKGKGKTKSGWLDRQMVTEQAKWIIRLRKLYASLDELYFPLFVLGFNVPIGYVRTSLCEPLEDMIQGLEEMASQWGILSERSQISDVVSEAVMDMTPLFEGLQKIDPLPVPLDVVEAGINVLVNPDYNLSGIDFNIGCSTYNEWKFQSYKLASKPNQTKLEASISTPGSNPIDFIFRNASFLKENLSLHNLQERLGNCTDELLEDVRHDLMALKRIAEMFGDFMRPLMEDLQHKWGSEDDSSDDALPQLFSLAKLLAWADISLRQKGYSELITRLRHEVPKQIEADIAASKEFESPEVRLGLIDGYEKGIKELEAVFGGLPLGR